jgi:RimJ/RimL family protein N-acetyltransferase
MTWHLTSDPELFRRHAVDLLRRDPVRHTVPLTVLASLLEPAGPPGEALLGWCGETGGETGGGAGGGAGSVRSAIVWTPPWDLLITDLTPVDARTLAVGLRRAGARPPGATGQIDPVNAFAEAWVSGTGLRVRAAMDQLLYRWDTPTEPPAAVSGRPERAREPDVPLIARWLEEFHAEAAPGPAAPTLAVARQRVAGGLAWLWRRPDGMAVSLAARHPVIGAASRIGPVYTPPEHRGHGYAGAVSAACGLDARQAGAREVVLFADLANATSNRVYRRIGFVPVAEYRDVRFDGSPDASGDRAPATGNGPPHP